MKKKSILFTLITLTFFLINVHAQPSSTQKSISLYEQPNSSAKVVGTIHPSKGIMPIFSKDGWTKVANPENGDVGWVSDAILKAQGLMYIKTITKTLNTPTQNKQMETIQFSFPNLNEQHINEMMERWQKDRIDFQKSMQHFQQLIDQMRNQSLQSTEMFLRSFTDQTKNGNASTTIIQPVIVIPQTPPSKNKEGAINPQQ